MTLLQQVGASLPRGIHVVAKFYNIYQLIDTN